MAVNDVFQTQVFYHAYQKQFITTMIWRETQEEQDTNPAARLNAGWTSTIMNPFLDLLSGATILGCIKTRKIVGIDYPEHVEYLQNKNGTQTGQPMPGSSALRLNTGATVQGRPNRGSLIISGISEADIIAGVFTADLTQTRLAAFIVALQAGLTAGVPGTGEWEFGYMSRAPVTPGTDLLDWPGTFINPSVYYSTGIPVVQRSRQGTHTQITT